MATLLKDLRVAARTLRKTPGFTAVVVLTLALGIGANAAIFSVLNAVLLRPLPYPTPDRIMTLWTNNGVQGWPEDVSGFPNFSDWRAQNTTFAEMAAYTATTRALTGSGEPEQLDGSVVFPSFFDVMAVSPARGRALTVEDFDAGRRVVVLSDELWRRRFGADPKILGTTVLLSGVPHEVVGVMPARFSFPSIQTQFWVPLAHNVTEEPRGNFWLRVVGRLKPGVSVDRARAELATIAARLEKEYPGSNANLGVTVIPLHEQTVGDVRPALLVLMGAVGFVLLIACANVANLLLARGAARAREIAVRAALGAGRARIVRQLLAESVTLAVLGGALGLLLAKWGVDLLVALGPAALPRMNEVTIDGSMLLFTLGASLVTALLFGLPPALRASSVDLSETMKQGTRSVSAARGGARVRRLLVVTEIALAMMLLIGAGLLIASFRKLSSIETGFDGSGVLTARLNLPPAKYAEPALATGFYTTLRERVSALPGVKSVGYTSSLPLGSFVNGAGIRIDGRPPMPDLDQKEVRRSIVSPEYFTTLGIRLLSGRGFTSQDRGDTVNVVVINETMKNLHFLGADPIGRRMRWGCVNDPCPWMTVIGVVNDYKQDALDVATLPEVYTSYLQDPRRAISLAVRTDGDPLAFAPMLRTTLRSIDPDIPLSAVATMDQLMGESVATRRFNTLLLGIFSSLALALAIVGIYGVMSYSVSQRSQEVGIRMALGAHAGQVTRLVLREAMTLAGIGIAIGVVLSIALTRLLGSLLFEVSATDATTFATTSLLLGAVALVASYIPARRAAGVDPLVALRSE